jgi:DNA repair exonuclease SbcCD ATPase subunit
VTDWRETVAAVLGGGAIAALGKALRDAFVESRKQRTEMERIRQQDRHRDDDVTERVYVSEREERIAMKVEMRELHAKILELTAANREQAIQLNMQAQWLEKQKERVEHLETQLAELMRAHQSLQHRYEQSQSQLETAKLHIARSIRRRTSSHSIPPVARIERVKP